MTRSGGCFTRRGQVGVSHDTVRWVFHITLSGVGVHMTLSGVGVSHDAVRWVFHMTLLGVGVSMTLLGVGVSHDTVRCGCFT